MVALSRLRQLSSETRAATALEYGIIGGVIALLVGLAFLQIGPHLADMIATAIQHLRGIKAAA